MRGAWLALAIAVWACWAAHAQDDARPVTPYKPVAAMLPAVEPPPGLDAFRARLLALAEARDLATLEETVDTKFFWDNDADGEFDAQKSAFENFSAALAFDQDEGNLGWSQLAQLAGHAAALHGKRRGVFCSPARPVYSEAELAELLGPTDSEASEWAAPRADGLKVRLYPRDDADAIETLGLHLVLVDGAESPRATDFRTWSIVMTPGGKRGYVPANDLVNVFSERLCFARNAAGVWRIAGFVGSGE